MTLLAINRDPVASTTPRGLPARGPRSAPGTDLTPKLAPDAHLCRPASYKRIPAATATLRLSVDPFIGMLTARSAAEISSVDRPRDSEPMINAVGRCQSISV